MNNKRSRAAVGLDIGGTKIAAGLVLWPSGKIVRRIVIPTRPSRGGNAVLTDTLDVAATLVEWARAHGIKVLGIGAGVAELVDGEGNVTSGQTIRWRRTPVQRELSKIVPAHVESDVRAGALGEAVFGAGKGCRIFVYVTVGTGISCCLVQDGRPFRGARGNALIFASSPFSTTCDHCGARLRPILEEFASGPGISRRYSQGHHAKKGQRDEEVSAEEVVRRAERRDRTALEIITSAGDALGVSTAFLVNVLDPERVVVGGGLGVAGGLYWKAFQRACREHIYADNARTLPIVPARLGVDAGLVGAAATVFTQEGMKDQKS
jgi:glucokinase